MNNATELVDTIYNSACKHLLVLMMEAVEARQAYHSSFSDLRAEDVFPPQLLDVARWVLTVDYPITYSMVKQRTEVPFLDDFAMLTPMDKSPQGVASHVEAFVSLYQSTTLERMGFAVDPTKTPAEQIDFLLTQLNSLGQKHVMAREARGDIRFQQARARINDSGGQGYRKFGLVKLDLKLPGVNYTDGDFGIIVAKRKHGKTRFALNLIIRALEMYADEQCTWVSTEPFSSPETIMLSIWAMLAAREAYDRGERWDIADTSIASVTDSRYSDIIETAAVKATELGQRLFIYGPALEDGNSSQLNSALATMHRNMAILGHRLLVVDNFQQFIIPGTKMNVTTDYELMLAVARAVSTLGAQHKAVLLGLSQVSKGGDMKGGEALAERAAWALEPAPHKTDSHKIAVTCKFARKAPWPWTENMQILPFSGWLTGD